MNLVELAQRIRQLRTDSGLTLEEVAQHSGQTRSWLSKVENFRITPSLPALAGIASALGVTTASLLEGLDKKPNIVLVKNGNGKVINRDSDSTIAYFSLASERVTRTMDPFVLRVPPGEQREARSHEGEEFLLLIKGRVKFEFDEQIFSLAKGDSLYFDSEVKHCLSNPYSSEAEVLCVFRLGR